MNLNKNWRIELCIYERGNYGVGDEEDEPGYNRKWTDNRYDGEGKWKDEIAGDYGDRYHKEPSKTIYIYNFFFVIDRTSLKYIAVHDLIYK